MKISHVNDSFKLFPYKKNKTNGSTNNGGIDLSEEPWRISEITEAADFPALLKLIEHFNAQEAPFITLGCEAGYIQGVFSGYIEFTFKNEQLANNLGYISKLDDDFHAWAQRKNPELCNALLATLAWECSPFSFHGNSNRLKVAIFFRAPDKEYASQLLKAVDTYFCTHLQLPNQL